MQIVDLNQAEGRVFPARRRTRNLVNGASPITCSNFSMGVVELEPLGGQVPWHNHPQEEVYLVLEGTGEICVNDERRAISAGQAVHVPAHAFHQLTNTGEAPLRFVYCYAPAGEVAHWRQELDGTLPPAGQGEIPDLPNGAWIQHTDAAPSMPRRPEGWAAPGPD